MSSNLSSDVTSQPVGGHRGLAVTGLGLVTAAALLVDAVIHLQLASIYQLAAPGGIGQGNLFRLEAVAAIIAAAYVVVRGSRLAYLTAFAVAAGGLAAVLVYRYFQVPAFGPIPAMYEPLWFTKKTVTAVAEALGTVTAGIGLLMTLRSPSLRSRRGDLNS